MDFLKILRSFEDFLFEAAGWLIFYPLTMWRIMRRPLSTMAYSDRENGVSEDKRYGDALSPPLVLLATILLCNLISLAAHIPMPEGASTITKTLTASQENFVLFRSLVFSLIPLVSAATLLRKQDKRLDRENLRAPFYAQCYLAAPCAVFVSAGGDIFQRPDVPNVIGAVIMIAGALWFLTIQTLWFRRKLEVGMVRAGFTAVWAVIRALAFMVALVFPIALL